VTCLEQDKKAFSDIPGMSFFVMYQLIIPDIHFYGKIISKYVRYDNIFCGTNRFDARRYAWLN
jgi:hypothetical protein